MKKRSPHLTRTRAVLLGALLLAAGGLLTHFYRVASRSPQAVFRRVLGGLSGCSVREVRETGPGTLVLGGIRVVDSSGAPLVSGAGGRAGFHSSGPDRKPELVSLSLTGIEIVDLDDFLLKIGEWARAGRRLPETVELAGFWRSAAGAVPFRFRSRLVAGEPRGVLLELGDGRGLVAEGRLEDGPRRVELTFRGELSGALLAAAGSPLPPEIVPGGAEASGRLLWMPEAPGAAEFEADCELAEPWSRRGGFWGVRSGKRCRIGWNRSGWSVAYPDSELVRPFSLPLGELAFSGGSGSEVRFRSGGIEPPAGEQTGRFELAGRFEPDTGRWEFRQSEASDRVVRWKFEHSFGQLECWWRRPRVSGSGMGGRGEIDYTFEFDRLSCIPASDPQAFEAQPGSVAGSWRFDFNDGGMGDALSGTVETARLEWPDPRSAWIAGRTRLAYRFTRQPGEAEWLLELEPDASSVALVGAELPKIKLESLSGRLAARLDPASSNRWPTRVDAALDIARVELIASVFGSGTLRDVRLAGTGELARAGAVRRHRFSGSIREAQMKLGELSATGELVNFDGVFDRNSMTPGDNHVTSIEADRLQVRGANLNFDTRRFRGRVSGELRGEELLPAAWLVDGAFPAGTFAGRNLAGSFERVSGRFRFASGRIDALELLFSRLRGGASDPGDGADRWNFELPALSIALRFAGNARWNGVARAENGMFRGAALRGDALAAEGLSFELPLASAEALPAPEGRFQVGRVELAGVLSGTAAGVLRQRFPGGFGFSGRAGRTADDTPFNFDGEAGFRVDGTFGSAGAFSLPAVRLAQPLALGPLLPFGGAGWTIGGELGAKGGWNFGSGRADWKLELLPVAAEIAADGLRLGGVSGSVRLPSGGEKRPGGELRFRSLDSGRFQLTDGETVFRLPDFDECDVVSGQANLWGGRARLAVPFSFRAGRGGADLSVRLDDFRFAGLGALFHLPPSLLAGRGSGTAVWRLAAGVPPLLAEAEFTASADRQIKLGELEPLVLGGGEPSPAHRIALEALRDFSCRELQLKLLAEAQPGRYRLTVSAFGRPTRPISVGDEKVRRFLSSVDPASLGLDEPVRVSLTYLLAEKEAK